ncbi:hypothetical protein TYRP_008527 [Tyrophagus putrescentiae]|nr:hypothetical protein TYRP_008527 [Tyrophagus putrescentiae]
MTEAEKRSKALGRLGRTIEKLLKKRLTDDYVQDLEKVDGFKKNKLTASVEDTYIETIDRFKMAIGDLRLAKANNNNNSSQQGALLNKKALKHDGTTSSFFGCEPSEPQSTQVTPTTLPCYTVNEDEFDLAGIRRLKKVTGELYDVIQRTDYEDSLEKKLFDMLFGRLPREITTYLMEKTDGKREMENVEKILAKKADLMLSNELASGYQQKKHLHFEVSKKEDEFRANDQQKPERGSASFAEKATTLWRTV